MARARRISAWVCLTALIAGLAVAWHLATLAGDPLAPIILPKENKALDARLKYARKLAAENKWGEAIETYAGILRDVGDKLSPVETPLDAVSSTSRSLQLRRQCHLDIAAFPKKALQQYQASVKGQTQQWLEDGIKNRDELPLLKIVREAFCCKEGDTALDFLGDLAFEKGDFHQALQWWQLLAAPPTEAALVVARLIGPLPTGPLPTTGRLLYPDPKIDIARVGAKIVMAQLFDGNEFQAKLEFAAFEKLHAKADGHLAGEKGNYVKILKKWLDKGSPNFDRDLSWSTFGGNNARNAAGTNLPHKRLWADGPTWSIKLVEGVEDSFPSSKSIAEKARQLPFYPIIVEERILLADGRSVFLFDLFSGQKLDTFTLPDKLFSPPKKADKPVGSGPINRATTSAADGKVFAVLGDPRFAPAKNGVRTATKSYLVVLELAGKEASTLKPLWQTRAEEQKDEAAIFEGTPIVHHGRVYVIHSRAKGLQVTSGIVCFDADTGKQIWQEELAKFTEAEDDHPPPVVDQAMLTLAGNQLIYCSQRGVIMGVDLWTGAQTWAVKYPSRGPITIEGTPSPRDLCPATYADGRLYAAPMDSDRILCLDPETGQVQWERDRIQVVHLLGCRFGKLFFTTPDALRAVNAVSGSDKTGWLQPAAGRLPAYGRGLLLGGWILWPTQHPEFPLRLVHHAHGLPHFQDQTFSPVQTRFIKPGNMAFANGCLVVAGTTELTGYVAPKHLLPKNQKDANAPKPAPPALYKLAQSEADAGQIDAALKHFQQAEKAANKEAWDGELFQWKCLTARHDLLMTAAKGEKDTEKTIKFLEQAKAPEFPAEWRLKAIKREASTWKHANELAKAVEIWQSVLDDENLRHAVVWSDDTPMRGKDIAESQIWKLMIKGTRLIYKPVEERAKKLVAQAQGSKQQAMFEQAVKQFPNAQINSTVLLELIKLLETKQQFGEARLAYERQAKWLSDDHAVQFGKPHTPDQKERDSCSEFIPEITEGLRQEKLIKPYIGIAKSFEKQGCWEAAAVKWRILVALDPVRKVSGPGSPRMADFVNDKMSQPPYSELPEVDIGCVAHLPEKAFLNTHLGIPGSAIPSQLSLLATPLQSIWQTPSGRLLQPAYGDQSPSQIEVFYTHFGNVLSCHESGTGKLLWKCQLPFSPTWLGTDADVVYAASPLGIAALSLERGQLLWAWTTKRSNASGEIYHLPPHPLYAAGSNTLGAFAIEADGLRFTQNARLSLKAARDTGEIVRDFLDNPWNEENWVAGVKVQPTLDETNEPLLDSANTQINANQFLSAKDARTIVLKNIAAIAYGLDANKKPYKQKFFPLGKQIQWTYTPRLPTTVTGELPRVFAHKCNLLILLPRNYGYDLERIDPKTGANVWKPAARVCDKPFERDGIAFKDGAVYYASGNTLLARNLDTGNLLWKRALPESVRGWRVKATKQSLLVFPGAMDEPQTVPVPLPAAKVVIPLPVKATPKYPFCLLALAYKDGAQLQRLDFVGDVSGAGIQFFPDSIVVTAGSKAYGIRGAKK